MSPDIFTPIHRALGIGASSISMELLDQAIANAVQEAEDLDWKSELPNVKAPDWQIEFSKDVAAMANGLGGMIVFGVKEDGKSAALARTDVETGAAIQQRLLQAAHNHVRPLVQGVTFSSLPSGSGSNLGILVVHVPASPDAPHQAGSDGSARVSYPYRNGAHTQYLREHEVARAYAERSRTAADLRARPIEVISATRARTIPRGGTWAMIVGTPLSRTFSSPTQLDRRGAVSVLEEAAQFSETLRSSGAQERFNFLEDARSLSGSELRREHRKWVVDTPTYLGHSGHLRCELHDDGSVALAVDQGAGTVSTDKNSPSRFVHFPIWRYESLLIDGLSLIQAFGRSAGRSGSWLVTADLVPSESGVPIVLVDFPRFGGRVGPGGHNFLEIPRDSRALDYPFSKLESELPTPADSDTIGSIADGLAIDFLNHFGLERGILLHTSARA